MTDHQALQARYRLERIIENAITDYTEHLTAEEVEAATASIADGILGAGWPGVIRPEPEAGPAAAQADR